MILSLAKSFQLWYKCFRLQTFPITPLQKLFHYFLTFAFAKKGEDSLIFATLPVFLITIMIFVGF